MQNQIIAAAPFSLITLSPSQNGKKSSHSLQSPLRLPWSKSGSPTLPDVGRLDITIWHRGRRWSRQGPSGAERIFATGRPARLRLLRRSMDGVGSAEPPVRGPER